VQANISLVMKTATGEDRPFPIRKSRTVIGREAVTDVRIALPSVASRHCEIVLTEAGLRLNDLGSPEGTLHNGSRVSEAVLAHKDRVTVGPVTFVVVVTHDTASPGVRDAASMAEVKPAALRPDSIRP